MAGAGYRSFSAGAVLTAAQVNTFLMEQSVMNFAGTAARGSALASVLSAGQMAHVGGGTVTIYDGSAWQQVYPAQPGLVYVAGTAFSAAASVSVNNCFTSTYANYRIMVQATSAGSSAEFRVRLRASGTDNSSNNYTYGSFRNNAWTTTTTTNNAGTALVSFWQIHPISGTGAAIPGAHSQFDICGPQAAEYASISGMGFYADNLSNNQVSGFFTGQMSVTTSYDGFSIFPNAGSITGTVRVYGYRNS